MSKKTSTAAKAKKTPKGGKPGKAKKNGNGAGASSSGNGGGGEGKPIVVKKGQCVVRMYCAGLGDCFLLAFPDEQGETAYVMIDCGVFRGTGGAKDWMTRIMEHIRDTCGARGLDLLIITHQHWDHISGFSPGQAQEAFLQIKIKRVWMPWTEESGNPVAMALAEQRRMKISAIDAATRLMRDAGADEANPQAFALKQTARNLSGLMKFVGFGTAEDDALEAGHAADQKHAESTEAKEESAPTGGGGGGALGADASFLGASQRMEALMDFIAGRVDKPEYPKPSLDPVRIPGIPGLRVYALGPPTNEALLGKDDPSAGTKSEVYLAGLGAASDQYLSDHPLHEEAGFYAAASAPAAAGGNDLDVDEQSIRERTFPFDQRYRILAHEAHDASLYDDDSYSRRAAEKLARFYSRRYGVVRSPDKSTATAAADDDDASAGEAAVAEDNYWRRIDTEWLATASALALDLDDHINNTSLALAFELGDDKDAPVLLFPGDAQVGNWLSWHELTNKKGKKDDPSIADLLKRTVLYKVGHHGSHNATLKALGLKMMTQRSRLMALIPVDYREAHKPKGSSEAGWNMPYGNLLEDLIVSTQGRVVQADTGVLKPLKEKPGHWTDETWESFQKGWEQAKKDGWKPEKTEAFAKAIRVVLAKGGADGAERPFYVELTIAP